MICLSLDFVSFILDSKLVCTWNDCSDLKRDAEFAFSRCDGGANIRNRNIAMNGSSSLAAIEHAITILPCIESSVCVEVSTAIIDFNRNTGW